MCVCVCVWGAQRVRGRNEGGGERLVPLNEGVLFTVAQGCNSDKPWLFVVCPVQRVGVPETPPK